MATKEDIKEAIYSELTTVITNNTSVSNPDDHVNQLNQRGTDAAYPFLGFEMFGAPNNTGLHGNVHVDDVVYAGGSIDYVTYRRDTRLTVAIGVLTDGDPHLKDQLYTAVQDRWGLYIRQNSPEKIHDDCERLRDGGYSDESDPESGIHGDRQQYTLDYGRYWNFSDFTPMNEIDFSIEDLDENKVYHSRDVTS